MKLRIALCYFILVVGCIKNPISDAYIIDPTVWEFKQQWIEDSIGFNAPSAVKETFTMQWNELSIEGQKGYGGIYKYINGPLVLKIDTMGYFERDSEKIVFFSINEQEAKLGDTIAWYYYQLTDQYFILIDSSKDQAESFSYKKN